MKKIILATLLAIAILTFGSMGFSANAGSSGAYWPKSFSLAQVNSTPPQPKESPSEKAKMPVDQDSAKNSKAHAPAKATAAPTPPVETAQPPKDKSSGPYDMEAMKAFSRSLYGS